MKRKFLIVENADGFRFKLSFDNEERMESFKKATKNRYEEVPFEVYDKFRATYRGVKLDDILGHGRPF